MNRVTPGLEATRLPLQHDQSLRINATAIDTDAVDDVQVFSRERGVLFREMVAARLIFQEEVMFPSKMCL